MVNRLLGIFIFFLPTLSNAALFGSENYEECINDGKVGRTAAEMKVLSTKCYNEFPKLYDLSIKKDVNLVCRDIDEKNVYRFEIRGQAVKIDKIPNKVFIKTSHDKTKMTFMGTGQSKEASKSINLYGNISPLNGSGDIKVQYEDKSLSDYVYKFTCYESK